MTPQPDIRTQDHDATATPRPHPPDQLPHRDDRTSRMPPTGDRRAGRRRATFELRIAPVAKQLGDATVRMLAYNGSIPGPTLKVPQGSEVDVNVVNQGDLEATVHWHGLRLENRYDGTHETQAPIAIGERFSARVDVPRPGRVLVSPAHPRGLRPGDGPVRQRPRRPGRSRLLAARAPRARAHARRHPDRGRQGRAVQPLRDDLRRDGPLRRRAARQRRAGARADRASAARSCAST